MKVRRPLLIAIPLAAAALAVAAGVLHAQLDGAERGIQPVDSVTNLEVTGVQVDVRAASGEAARSEGWRRAQALGWRMLWARTHRRPQSEAPNLPESTLSGIVSGIIIEQEQIGPNRYIARLGVMFDRARTSQLLGVAGVVARSAPLLVIPVMTTGASTYSFEFRNEWQRAWAQYRTAGSTIDYVRSPGTGIAPLLLNYGQSRRRGRGWWRMLLNQYGAADIVIAEVELRRLYPGGPALGVFTARYGPDGMALARFVLRAANSASVPTMLDEGVRRMDGIYREALARGLLRPDPSLVIIAPALPPALEDETAEDPLAETPVDGATSPPSGAPQRFSVQVATPDGNAVQRAEIGISRVPGVTSALTTTLALGGNSVLSVTFAGDAAAFAAALRAQGWTVSGSGSSLRISR